MKKANLILILAVFAILPALSAYGQETAEEKTGKATVSQKNGDEHPIDIQMNRELEADDSNAGRFQAYERAAEAWDAELNKNYRELMNILSEKQREQLRASQRKWIEYRDLELTFNSGYWNLFSGSMFATYPSYYEVYLVRERALRLGKYANDFKEER